MRIWHFLLFSIIFEISIIIVSYSEITFPRSYIFARVIRRLVATLEESSVWHLLLSTFVDRCVCSFIEQIFIALRSNDPRYAKSRDDEAVAGYICIYLSKSTFSCTIARDPCMTSGAWFSLNVREECTSRRCRADRLASVAKSRVTASLAYPLSPGCSSSVLEIPINYRDKLLVIFNLWNAVLGSI